MSLLDGPRKSTRPRVGFFELLTYFPHSCCVNPDVMSMSVIQEGAASTQDPLHRDAHFRCFRAVMVRLRRGLEGRRSQLFCLWSLTGFCAKMPWFVCSASSVSQERAAGHTCLSQLSVIMLRISTKTPQYQPLRARLKSLEDR